MKIFVMLMLFIFTILTVVSISFGLSAVIILNLCFYIYAGCLINLVVGPPFSWRLVLVWLPGMLSSKIRDWEIRNVK